MRLISLAAVLVVMMAAHTAYAQMTGEITGCVVAPDGSPIRGATVRVLGTSPPRGAVTREDGNFLIRNIPPGVYQLQFMAVHYKHRRIAGVKVSPTETTDIDVTGMQESGPESDIQVILADRNLVRRDRFGTIQTITFRSNCRNFGLYDMR